MLDRSSGTITLIDRKTDGGVGLTNSTWPPRGQMSCDGSLIVFLYPSNLITGSQDSGHLDVYLLDRRNGANKLTNLTGFANNSGSAPTISCNGDFIGFKSAATNIDPSFTPVPSRYKPYIYDRVNNTYHLAAVTTTGGASNKYICGTTASAGSCIWLSDTGLGVFMAEDSDLTGASGKQIYMRDIYAGTTQLVSRNALGEAGNNDPYGSDNPVISADGRITSYASQSSNLVTGDTNNYRDIFTSQTGY